MGDGADMAISEMEDMEDLRLDYKLGYLSDIEAYDAGIINELGGLIGTERPKYIRSRLLPQSENERAQYDFRKYKK